MLASCVPTSAKQVDDLASRFAVAPDSPPPQQLLVSIEINGIDCGDHVVQISGKEITLSPATLLKLHIRNNSASGLSLMKARNLHYDYDVVNGHLALQVPSAMLAPQAFAPEDHSDDIHLSPETWGAYLDYDVNVRHNFQSKTAEDVGSPTNGANAWGGIVNARVIAPNLVGDLGWAYDSARLGARQTRLDDVVTWRPSWVSFAVSAGDVISTTTASLTEARAYRFGGVQVGSDFSRNPGWSTSSIPSITGTAEAQSSIDVYLDGQRTYQAATPGGPFSLVLPPGSTGLGANVVVTDVTGRATVIPVDVPRVDAQLLRKGVFLWSAGVGAPRFAYGSTNTSYDGRAFGYLNARYGLWNKVSTAFHVESGPGLAEGEVGADVAVSPWLATHGSASASRSGRGAGGAGRISFVVSGPWRLGVEATAARTIGTFDDVVSVSGRAYDRRQGLNPSLSLPARTELSVRPTWQATSRFSVSASFDSRSYKDAPTVGFATINANYLAAGRVPVFANLTQAIGGQKGLAFVVGMSLTFGRTQASASAGYGSDGGGTMSGYSGGVTASHRLGDAVGDVGWDAYLNKSPTGTFATADAQVRTGFGVPGIAAQSLNGQTTGFVTLRGSAGLIGGHAFITDPAHGGIIIADTGQSGVPVELNGYAKGRSWVDGKLAITGAVAGVAQRLTIDTARMSIEAVPTETDRVAVVRDGGASVVSFGVHSTASSAVVFVTYRGVAPPLGSTLASSRSSAPISKEGRAFLPSLKAHEVLSVELPDGNRCQVRTDFDGHGGVGRRLGPFRCIPLHL